MNKIIFLLHEILTWQAILDITIIAAGLFFLYRTLVRLGTWKIVVGILAAFVVISLASILNLDGITWIFQNVSNVAVIALIVIFQPELRKVFEKVVSLQKRKSVSVDDGLIDMVATSLSLLAKQKRGAIIVYPGKEPVQEKLSGGHRLAAEPSIPLIMSIFDPNSPGHDGAMIVEENKLTSFGVRLPISQTSRLPEDYGTRHHAAMGLAEQTDALVLVVSEERGVISAFKDRTMKVLASIAEISLIIRDHNTQNGLFDMELQSLMNRRTLIPVGMSLAIAVVFWSTLITANRQVVEKTFPMSLDYIPPPKNLLLIDENTEQIRVRLAGPKSEIDSFYMSQPTAEVDLSNMVEGKQTILITADNLRLPPKMSFLGSEPAQIEVNLAGIIKKTIPIIPQLVGSLPAGLKIKEVRVIPNEVTVMLPVPKNGEKLPSVATTPVYLNSIQGETRIFCKIIAEPTIQPVSRPWQDVQVVIEVESSK
ncbi:MAG: diadenylate cyclase [Desulforhopalus sp.]